MQSIKEAVSNDLKYAKKIIKKHNRLITIIGIVFLLILFDLAVGGSIKYYSKWADCGRKPLVLAQGIAWGGGVRHYYEPPNFEIIRLHSENYACTEVEAERLKYSSNPNHYEYKHLYQD